MFLFELFRDQNSSSRRSYQKFEHTRKEKRVSEVDKKKKKKKKDSTAL